MNKKKLALIISAAVALLIVTMVIVCALVSCGSNSQKNETDNSTVVSTTQEVLETTIATESTTAQPSTTEETTVKQEETKATETTEKPTEKSSEKSENSSSSNKNNSSSSSNSSQNNSSDSTKAYLSLSKTSLSLKEGESKTLTLSYGPANLSEFSYNVKTDNDCATVQCSGTTITVMGKKAGESVVTVKGSNGKSAVCNVTVKAKVSSSSVVVDNPYQAYADEVLKLVNKERANKGLSKLTLRNDICAIANERAKEIVTQYSHTRPDGTKVYESIVFEWHKGNCAAENLAKGQNSASEVMNDWMNSQTHRENILDSRYSGLGVGFYESNGVCYWVQIFVG